MITQYIEKAVWQISENENEIDRVADRVSNYLIQLSAHITAPDHIEIMNHYYTVITEFEHLGDQAINLAEIATALNQNKAAFSKEILSELTVLRELIDTILDYSGETFRRRSLIAARHIEPLEEVVDDMVSALKDNHPDRLREGGCSIFVGMECLHVLSEVERILDICSNIGMATIARVKPELKHHVHDYVAMLHSGQDEEFNHQYPEAHNRYFRLLNSLKER